MIFIIFATGILDNDQELLKKTLDKMQSL